MDGDAEPRTAPPVVLHDLGGEEVLDLLRDVFLRKLAVDCGIGWRWDGVGDLLGKATMQ